MRALLLLLALPTIVSLCITVDPALTLFSLRLGEGSCHCSVPACGERLLAANETACFTKNTTDPGCAPAHVNLGGSLGVKGQEDEHKCHTFDIDWD